MRKQAVAGLVALVTTVQVQAQQRMFVPQGRVMQVPPQMMYHPPTMPMPQPTYIVPNAGATPMQSPGRIFVNPPQMQNYVPYYAPQRNTINVAPRQIEPYAGATQMYPNGQTIITVPSVRGISPNVINTPSVSNSPPVRNVQIPPQQYVEPYAGATQMYPDGVQRTLPPQTIYYYYTR